MSEPGQEPSENRETGMDVLGAIRSRGLHRLRAIELAVEWGLTREAAERAVDDVLNDVSPEARPPLRGKDGRA